MILVWFRRDLRTLDHTALQAALDSGQPVVACFIATPQQWQSHDMAPMQADLIARHLAPESRASRAEHSVFVCRSRQLLRLQRRHRPLGESPKRHERHGKYPL